MRLLGTMSFWSKWAAFIYTASLTDPALRASTVLYVDLLWLSLFQQVRSKALMQK